MKDIKNSDGEFLRFYWPFLLIIIFFGSDARYTLEAFSTTFYKTLGIRVWLGSYS